MTNPKKFKSAPLPVNESARLERLKTYSVLDTSPEAAFDEITKLASEICGVPIALVSLIDENRQWFKSRVGLDAAETPREVAFCAHAILDDRPFLVSDAHQDERFAENPLVTGAPNVRFYLGIPLKAPDSTLIGTLCAIDTEPRTLSEFQIRAMEVLANQVISQLELRRALALEAQRTRELQDSRENYRALIENLKEIVFQVDSGGELTYLTPAWSEVLGYDIEECIGKSFLDFVPQEDRETQHQRFLNLIKRERESCRRQIRVLDYLGRERWVEVFVRVSLNSSGEVAGASGTVTDVHEQRLIQNQLIEEKGTLDLIAANITDLIWIRDPETGHLVYLSQAFEQIWQRDREEAMTDANLFIDSIHPEDREHMSEVIKNQAFGTFIEEYRILTPSGEERWIVDRAIPVARGDGSIYRIVGIAADFTERRRKDKLIEIQRMKMMSSSKMSALGEMAAGVAHEINNPLAIIKGNAQLMKRNIQRGAIDPNQMTEMLDRLVDTVGRIAKIISGLRAFSREGNHDKFELASVAAIVQGTFDFCQTRFSNSGVELKAGEIPADAQIRCRSVQISQVLLNLLNNAFDAVMPQENRWVRVDYHDKGERVQITVTDSGIGIPEAIREKIMEPFFTTKEVGKGTGLGLSLSKGLVEAHHGQLFLDTESPNTRFIIELPKNPT